MIPYVTLLIAAVIAGITANFMRREIKALPLWLVVVSLIVAVAGSSLVFWSSEKLSYHRMLENWPTAEGTVVLSEVIGERATRPNIVYKYTVDSTEHLDSSSLHMPPFGGRKSKHHAASEMASMYPVGKKLSVFYNPIQPDMSVIKPAPPWEVYGQLGLGAFLFGLGLFVLVVRFFLPPSP
jgi:hypothetical protein